MTKTCAYCGWRDAGDACDEGKPICSECNSDGRITPRGDCRKAASSGRLLQIVEIHGPVDIDGIAEIMGLDTRERENAAHRLSELYRAGKLFCDRSTRPVVYSVAA